MAGNAHHAIDKMGYKLIGMIRRRNGVGSPLSLSGLALAPGLSSEDAKTLLLGSLRGSGPLGRRVWLTAWMHWILGLQPRLSAGSGKGQGETLPAWEKNPVTPQLPAGWRKGQSLLAPAQPHACAREARLCEGSGAAGQRLAWKPAEKGLLWRPCPSLPQLPLRPRLPPWTPQCGLSALPALRAVSGRPAAALPLVRPLNPVFLPAALGCTSGHDPGRGAQGGDVTVCAGLHPACHHSAGALLSGPLNVPFCPGRFPCL